MAIDLPRGWAWATPMDLASSEDHSLGIGPFGSDLKVSDYRDAGVPLVFVRNVRTQTFGGDRDRYISLAKAEALGAHRVRVGDLLVTKMGDPPGDVCLYPEGEPDAVMTADCIRLRLHEMLNVRKYFLYAFRSDIVRDQIVQRTGGVAQQKISLEKFRTILIPVPPLMEQGRIVAAVEQELSSIDSGVRSLERVLVNIDRFRAAILEAACEGRLVPTEAELARKEGREYESGDVLLRRILAERRVRWEADQLAMFKAKGQLPRDDRWKAKYEEPKGPNTNEFPEQPEGWLRATLNMICPVFVDCEHRTPKYQLDGLPALRPRDVVGGVLNVNGAARVSEHEYEIQIVRRRPVGGDVVYSRELSFGWAVVVPEHVRLCLSQGMVLFRPADGVSSVYLKTFLNSPVGRRQSKRAATGSAHPHVNLGDIRNFVIDVPPIAEQQRILEEVDRRLSVADETEQAVRVLLARGRRLRQAVLKRAFEGKLVPQDPNDEPASVLLERIRSTQITTALKKPRRQSARRRAPNTEMEP
ncbi:restriction endonuclease subunit S [Sorangium sp. So ce861]|uniref:restriction endonuclease subunit S n=1 Tax=Sorangium sp. So ce861 TaxID=3133323 RepID=UPI003F60370A